MIELLIAAIAVVLFFIYLSRVKKAKNQSPKPATQTEESKPIVHTEPKIEATVKPKISSAAIPTQQNRNNNAPQDSTLKRHFLSHLREMSESLKHPRPTDSSLSRHYDSLINAEIEQCVNDKGALERLICNYESHKKTLAQQIQSSKTLAEPLLKTKTSPTIAEPNLSLRPTDSALRRHYDTMISTQTNKTPKA
jgi:hypothetical protein